MKVFTLVLTLVASLCGSGAVASAPNSGNTGHSPGVCLLQFAYGGESFLLFNGVQIEEGPVASVKGDAILLSNSGVCVVLDHSMDNNFVR
jgi:hypothetical protein